MSNYISGKFERNAACHLAQQIKEYEDAWAEVVASTSSYPDKIRTPFEIMKEALIRLDIDATDDMVYRYVDYWIRDAGVINEFVADLRQKG